NPLPDGMRIKVAAWIPAQGRDDAVWMPAPFSSKGYEGSAQIPKKPPAQKIYPHPRSLPHNPLTASPRNGRE
ncbi:hypothetical protein, partial [Aurantimonas sp. C2-4-R8]|uniref:hypothetical protein n=1 Tax=Aurantimonas sp. C2-4-R8 TaxID=3114364 RepID=UPI002E19CE8F|nr:hypothetical protein [Aurantimonas sp. C2-4-R8]